MAITVNYSTFNMGSFFNKVETKIGNQDGRLSFGELKNLDGSVDGDASYNETEKQVVHDLFKNEYQIDRFGLAALGGGFDGQVAIREATGYLSNITAGNTSIANYYKTHGGSDEGGTSAAKPAYVTDDKFTNFKSDYKDGSLTWDSKDGTKTYWTNPSGGKDVYITDISTGEKRKTTTDNLDWAAASNTATGANAAPNPDTGKTGKAAITDSPEDVKSKLNDLNTAKAAIDDVENLNLNNNGATSKDGNVTADEINNALGQIQASYNDTPNSDTAGIASLKERYNRINYLKNNFGAINGKDANPSQNIINGADVVSSITGEAAATDSTAAKARVKTAQSDTGLDKSKFESAFEAILKETSVADPGNSQALKNPTPSSNGLVTKDNLNYWLQQHTNNDEHRTVAQFLLNHFDDIDMSVNVDQHINFGDVAASAFS